MKKKFYVFLERAVVKVVLYLLGVSAGFPAYLASQLIEYGYEKFVIPFSNLLIRKGLLVYDIERGRIITRRMDAASENNNQNAYDSAWDDMFK